ncbi:MAG: MFS transporter [Williamsia sp.]|nr:MFS transporter [Williamsia sp.]
MNANGDTVKTGVFPTSVIENTVHTASTGINRMHVGLFVLCFLSSMLGGTVSTLMSVYLPVAVRDLLGSRDAEQLNRISAYINALFIFGWAIGGFLWGVISDRIGRKKSLLLAVACYGLATSLTGLMHNWESIVFCRFASGFGVGGVLVISFTLLSEVWPEKSRAVFTGILSIGIPVGIFSAGLINYIVSSWRQGFLVGLIPLALALLGTWLLEEPPNGSKQGENGRGHWTADLFSAAHRRDLLIGSLTFGTMLIGLWAIFSWLPTWVQSLLSGHDAQKERGLSMMLMGMGGLTGGFVSGWFSKAIGNQRAMIACFAVCTLLSFLLFKTNSHFSGIVYTEIAVLAFFFGVSQGVLSIYIPHLFPRTLRATATGFCFNIGRLFTGTAVLFVGVLVASLGGYGNAIFLFSLVFVVGLFAVLFLKHKPTTV